MNKLNFQRRMMYRLKRDMGIRITYYQPIQNDYDIQTGATTRDYTVLTVKRALVFETRQLREFVYDLSFIAANKNFTMGGHFDSVTRVVAFHREDTPTGFAPDINDSIFIKNRKYAVKEIAELEDNEIIAFKAREVKGLIKREFHTVSLESILNVGGTVA